jgi:DNA-directed RNA polymerase specialized sigma24 family protein
MNIAVWRCSAKRQDCVAVLKNLCVTISSYHHFPLLTSTASSRSFVTYLRCKKNLADVTNKWRTAGITKGGGQSRWMADIATPDAGMVDERRPSSLAFLPNDDPDAASMVAFGVSEAERLDIEKRALVYASLALARRTRRRLFGGASPGMTPEDLLQTAFAKLLSGDRKRPDGVSLIAFLIEVIKSEMSHQTEKSANRPEHTAIAQETTATTIAASAIPDRASADDGVLATDLLQRIGKRFSAEPLVLAYASLLADGQCQSAAECAATLNVTECRIYQIRRRLQRFLKRERRTR